MHYWEQHADLLIPHRECCHNPACKTSCDMQMRTDADFIASRLIHAHLYGIAGKKEFVQFLVQMNPLIAAEIQNISGLQPTYRLYNCIKIKFLRKALLARNFGITRAEYEVILNHPRFLKKG